MEKNKKSMKNNFLNSSPSFSNLSTLNNYGLNMNLTRQQSKSESSDSSQDINLTVVAISKKHNEPVNNNSNNDSNNEPMATVVSCYYIIPNKHGDEKYAEWISNFMLLNANKIVYCDQKSYQYLSLKYSEKNNLKYVIKEMNDFYVNKWDWKKDEDLDYEIIRGHNEYLYKIWAEKIFFVKDAIERNIFKNDIY